MLGRGTIQACPVLVLCPRHLLSATAEESWMDACLKLITHLFQQL